MTAYDPKFCIDCMASKVDITTNSISGNLIHQLVCILYLTNDNTFRSVIRSAKYDAEMLKQEIPADWCVLKHPESAS